MGGLDLASLRDSWELSLRAARMSPQTLKSYRNSLNMYLAWCADRAEYPTLSRAQVRAFIADTLDQGRSAATAGSRLNALKQLSKWLVAEDELEADQLHGIRAPQVDDVVTPPLTVDQLRALIAACSGKNFTDRRDAAIVRFMSDTPARAGEVAAMRLDHVDLATGRALVYRGKGGKGRNVSFGPATGQAIDRYLRIRRKQPRADAPNLWLGANGQSFGYQGLWKTLKTRAEAAGIADFHPHVMRHTYADRWLEAGGSEQGLKAVAGWKRSDMLERYSRARAGERALNEAKALRLGDDL